MDDSFFLSPFSKTCITLSNPYSSSEYPMSVAATVKSELSLLYPILFTISCLFFVYARMLVSWPSFTP